MTPRVLCLCAVLFIFPDLTAAQTSGRVFLRALGGATTGMGTDGLVGTAIGGIGFTLGDRDPFEPSGIGDYGGMIITEFGRIERVLPNDVERDIADAAARLAASVGVPVEIRASAPAYYGLVGFRANLTTPHRAMPFIEAGVGWQWIRVSLDADVSDQNATEFRDDLANDTKGGVLVVFGGGINLHASDRVGFDIGYRLNAMIRKFTLLDVGPGEPGTSEAELVLTNSFYGGVRYSF